MAHPHRSAQGRRSRPRRRRSLLGTVFMLIGVAAMLVLLARYVVVPVLVMLPSWMGGGV